MPKQPVVAAKEVAAKEKVSKKRTRADVAKEIEEEPSSDDARTKKSTRETKPTKVTPPPSKPVQITTDDDDEEEPPVEEEDEAILEEFLAPSSPVAEEKKPMGEPLDKYPISEPTKARLRAQGITTLFPIQCSTFKDAFAGHDVIGRARTGTGKTLAFTLPLLERFAKELGARDGRPVRAGRGRGPMALIVLPTRELARQVFTVIEDTAPHGAYSVSCFYGGVSYYGQEKDLADGIDILVATPGRCIDWIERGKLKLNDIKAVVLDEADQMLDQGFGPAIETIMAAVAKARGIAEPEGDANAAKKRKTEGGAVTGPRPYQMLLFTATLPPWAQKMADRFMATDRKLIDLVTGTKNQAAEGVRHIAIMCTAPERAGVLENVVSTYCGISGRAIVFCKTRAETEELAARIRIPTQCLHGQVQQNKREIVMGGFREGKFRCLVASDVAARGLDIPDVDVVVQIDAPADKDMYIHRQGVRHVPVVRV